MVVTKFPFPWLVVGLSLAAAALAAGIRPGRVDVPAGAALGTATAGTFTAVALAVMARLKKTHGRQAGPLMVNAFVGLMAARMIGYLALVLAAVFLGAGEPVSVCAGLAAGTLVFQVLEVVYLRKAAS